jgi:hypothetical protein
MVFYRKLRHRFRRIDLDRKDAISEHSGSKAPETFVTIATIIWRDVP